MRLQLKLAHKGIILVAVPLILNLGFLAILTYLLHQAEIEVKTLMRSREIISESNFLSKLFIDSGVALAGYSITKSQLFAERYQKISHDIPETINNLRELVGDNKEQAEIIDHLDQISSSTRQLLGEAKKAIDDSELDVVSQFSARNMFGEIRNLNDKLQEELKALTDQEQKIQNRLPEERERSQRAVKIFLIVGVAVNILLAVMMALFFMKGISRGLNALSDNVVRLARGDKLNPALSGSDEVAVVDQAFHGMAGALAEASRKERAIVENAADVICSIDIDGKFVAVNPACEATWGYLPDELAGRRFIELIAPEDVNLTIKAMRAIKSQKGTMPFENRTKRKDGSLINVLWSAYWSEAERSMFCVAHNITERKLAEEAVKASELRIRTVIENMIVALVIITKDGQIESVNPSAERIFGYRAEEMVGKHVLMLFADAKIFAVENENDCSQFMENLYQRALYKIGEFDCLKRTGEDLPVELSLTEFQTQEGTRFMANILDVSERREVERLKKEFVATVSHELRTPLTSIRGSLGLLIAGAMGSLPEKAKQMVSLAERNTLRLIALINDILDIEKLEAGKLDMVFNTVAIDPVIERSLEAVRAFAEQNGVKLEAQRSEANVYADGDRLVQVIVNLLSNAVKFSPKGETVTIAVEELPKWIEVKVVDRGRGIPEKYKNLLFQRFQQVEASDARKKGGTGLGLAICKGIVEQHGGSIGVDSQEGKGSVFWFRIPPAQDNAAQKSA
jgi:PAS domain S-box-containing protein